MTDQELIQRAVEAREIAYAPYSKFRVGAAALLANGTVVTGANMENASFGLTVCAERHAMAAAVATGAKPGDVRAVAIAAHAETATPPCGACRQVMMEFATAETRILTYNLRDQSTQTVSLGELLPGAFVGSSLRKP